MKILANYILIKKIGEGTYGFVWLAHSYGNPEDRVAIKIFKEKANDGTELNT